jgi:PAS domain S-box-containing protein
MDLRLQLRPAQVTAFAVLQDVLDEGERLAAADRLLVRPGLPEVVAVRDWACEQIIAQVAGSPAAPWPGADDDRFTDEVGEAPVPAGWDDAPVRESAHGAIAVDEANRVVAVSRPLAGLLGWAPDDLVGRRVVAIIPPRFREAHVAGFSRHLSTGNARALGVDLELPVLRADGTELACHFLIESTPTPAGRVVYLAWISPLMEPSAPVG